MLGWNLSSLKRFDCLIRTYGYVCLWNQIWVPREVSHHLLCKLFLENNSPTVYADTSKWKEFSENRLSIVFLDVRPFKKVLGTTCPIQVFRSGRCLSANLILNGVNVGLHKPSMGFNRHAKLAKHGALDGTSYIHIPYTTLNINCMCVQLRSMF